MEGSNNILGDHLKARQEQILKGFYLDTPENRRKGRVGMGYDADAGVSLTKEDLLKKFPPPEKKDTKVKFSVKTGDHIIFQTEDGKRFQGRITRYPSNDKIEINYGTVSIKKEMIIGANGKLFPEHSASTEKIEPISAPSRGVGVEEGGTDSEKALRAAEKMKLAGEIQAFKDVLKERALKNLSTPQREFDEYAKKVTRWKQLGGGSTSLYGFVPKETPSVEIPVENPEEVDRTRKPEDRKLVSIVDKVKDTLAEFFDVDTVTAYRLDFMKSPIYKESLKGGFDERKIIDAFENYISSYYSPRGITSVF